MLYCKNKTSYDEWSLYYQSKNANWNDLTNPQQFVLIRSYKRKLNIPSNIVDNKIIINDIKKDLREKLNCDAGINARMRIRFAI